MTGKRTGPKLAAKGSAEEAQGPLSRKETRQVRQRTTHVRRSMLQRAAELFAERGYAGTNLRDLADALGMSRPGIYYHFRSKEKLLEALMDEVTISAEREQAEMLRNRGDDPQDALRSVVYRSTLWVLENRLLFRVLDRLETEFPPEMRARHDMAKKAILEQITDIVKWGIDVGTFRPEDPHVATLAIMGMRNWGAWWFKPEGRLTAQAVADIVAEMCVRSILRSDTYRSRSNQVSDVLRILREDVAHLSQLLEE